MRIVDFTAAHIEQAARIAKQNYEEEREHVPALPPADKLPDLMPFAKNNLGVAALDGDNLIGFLCSVLPFQNAFRSTDATGVFSPMGANGVVAEDRAKVYARLYQAAGDKWVRAGASSHAVCLSEHRGKGIFQNLLNNLIRILGAEGYTRLGVDFESINLTAYGFWLKYFDSYTHGVVRRIDEHAVGNLKLK